MRPSRTRSVPLLALLAMLLLGGCDSAVTGNPSPTPADFTGIASAIGSAGITLSTPISGDPGCQDSTLAPTAISMSASGLDQATPIKIYLYIFADRATFERLRPRVDLCAKSYVTDAAGFETLAISPFEVAGQGPWGPVFKQRLRDALTLAAGSGD